MYKSIYSEVPRNEAELIEIEKKTHAILLKTLDINLTKKRSEKLRNITCSFLGFPNGYQQLLSHWESSKLVVINDMESLMNKVRTRKGAFVFFHSDSARNVDAMSLMVRYTMSCIKNNMQKTPTKNPKETKSSLRRDADLISVGLLKNQYSISELKSYIELGRLVTASIEEKTSCLAEDKLRESGLLDKVPNDQIYLVNSSDLLLMADKK